MIATAVLVLAGLVTLALMPFVGLLAAVLIAAVAARVSPRGPATVDPSDPDLPRLLVVIPAHDEQAMIAATVRSCRSSRYDAGRFDVHVIADNCSDRTAESARDAGAAVYERTHPILRSKGHALEEFFNSVPEARSATGRYDSVVLVDADTQLDPDALLWFAAALRRGDDWVQGYYTVANADASWRTRLITYAFSLINGTWMLGLDRLGLGVGLKGNGMAFSRAGLMRFPWKAHGLVEDMEFAWMLRAAGERVRFEPRAVVRGEMVSQGGPAAESQRIRWESGRAELRRRFRSQLLSSRHFGPLARAGYLIDLQYPPLGTLAIATCFALTLAAAVAGLDRGGPGRYATGLAIADGVMVAAVLSYIASPFWVMGLPIRYAAALFAAPGYLAWKLVRIAGRRPSSWVRTPREASIPAKIDP